MNSFFLLGGSNVCANFGENRSRNATVRVLADGQTYTLTDANRFYNLSHAICYSYGTDLFIVLIQNVTETNFTYSKYIHHLM